MPKDAISLPPLPAVAPSWGCVLLRPVSSRDAGMAMALATDPYVCATGTLPLNAGEQEALAFELFIEPWNSASIRTAERAGYAPSGTRPDYPLAGGERRDMRVYAALRPGEFAAD